jgi:ubiquinone/menaquinone biosynthesis C-methylase UbiE
MPNKEPTARPGASASLPADTADRYLATRFAPDPRRDRVWQHIVSYLSRWWTPDAAVLDVGAGYCSFINAVRARDRVAVDVHARLPEFAQPGVRTLQASATDLTALPSGSFDVVFASNLLEHLSRDDIGLALDEFRRVLTADGRLILIQPNYRLCTRHYFDDFTHLTPLSDVSLQDIVAAHGYRVLACQARFIPFSLRSRLAGLEAVLPVYLRLPFRPLAQQLLLVATLDQGE